MLWTVVNLASALEEGGEAVQKAVTELSHQGEVFAAAKRENGELEYDTTNPLEIAALEDMVYRSLDAFHALRREYREADDKCTYLADYGKTKEEYDGLCGRGIVLPGSWRGSSPTLTLRRARPGQTNGLRGENERN